MQFAAVGKLQLFVVGEVEFKLHERGEVEELVAQFSQFAAESAPHLVHGQAVLGGRGGGDEVCHGFGLAQVHLAVEEGAAGVFAGLGEARAVADE